MKKFFILFLLFSYDITELNIQMNKFEYDLLDEVNKKTKFLIVVYGFNIVWNLFEFFSIWLK